MLFCTFKNLSVRYLVLPLDAEETAKTTHVEVVKLSGVAGLHCPGLTGVEKGGKDHCTIHLELGFQTESSALPDTFPESPE